MVAAVSGGSDSVALLVILHALHARGEVTLDAVAHLNHRIRGADADADEAFCRALATRLEVPYVAGTEDVAARARSTRASVEVAGREARRAFLDGVLAARGADCVATAHTADDQAETVLLRLTRGTGLRGLGGIAPMAPRRVRPLLDCSRADLRDLLHARGETWRDDLTNADLANPRNRVRHELLPYLEQHFNPAVRRALTRLADLARADDALLDRDAVATSLALLRGVPPRVTLAADRLHALPEAIARRVIRLALESATGAAATLDDVETVRAVAAGDRAAAELSRVLVEHSGPSVVLIRKDTTGAEPAPFRFDLTIPGTVTWAPGGWTVEAVGPIDRPRAPLHLAGPDEVLIEAAGLGGALVVRSRQPGDRLRPFGMTGQKKVQDVFVDRKVDRDARDLVPIVTDRAGRIVWVGGHVLGEDFRVTEHTNTVVILKLRRI